jgi:glycosyltransferase involved in cell wall biosynthesis/FMN phosphatase YigB (HAD superfamily)
MLAQTNQGPDVVTLDVWNTLLHRHCHPDEVKLAAARYLRLSHGCRIRAEFRNERTIFDRRRQAEITIGNRTRAEGHDDEYHIREVWSTALREIAVESADTDLDALADAVVRFELEFEERVSYPDALIGEMLRRRYPGGDVHLHILSDFYVGLDELLALVRRKHPALTFQGGMVSCEERVNKRTGRLFRRFQKRAALSPSVHLHIGDNLQCDVVKAQEAGAAAEHYLNPQEDHKRQRLEREFQARLRGDMKLYWENLRHCALASTATHARAGDERFRLGVEFAPALVLYVLFAIDTAMEAGARRIYYFTREGEILAEIHRRIAEALPHHAFPDAELLEVSRLSTFGPSIAELSLRELSRFWTMYPRHSMRTLFASLGVDPRRYAPFVIDAKIELDELLQLPWKDARFVSLLENADFRSELELELAERRKGLLAYLAQKGIEPGSSHVAVVDIGWRGTIQDNLARVLPAVQWHGVYLALFRFLNAQPANGSKHAFLFNDNLGDPGERTLTPQAPVEMLFNSSSGSVVGYANDGTAWIAQRRREPGEDRVHEHFTSVAQEAVLASVDAIVRWTDQRAVGAADFRPFVRQLFRDLLSAPPRAFARAYFELEHNETFGMGAYVKRESGIASVFASARAPRAAWEALKRRPKESGWPAGFLTAHPIAETPILAARLSGRAHDARRAYKLAGRIVREVWNHSKRRGLVPVLAEVRDGLVRRPPARPHNTAASTVSLVGAVDLQNETQRDFNALMRAARATATGPLVVAWIFPDIGLGSGGHKTLLRFARHFRSLGIVNRIYIRGSSQHKTRTALRRFVEAHYGSLDGIEVYTTTKNLHESDILIATHWSTAYEVFRAEQTRFKAYFVQDYEPYFYARGSSSTFAENTYSMNFYGICASPWLHQVTTSEYGMNGCFFHLGNEPTTYYCDPLVERDPNRVAVYMRPSTERRGTELLLSALLFLKKNRPATRITVFGTGSLPNVGLQAEVLGAQNEEQLRQLFNGSAITLLTSFTNYSLIPIEAMACGSVVVDLDLPSMRATFDREAPIVLTSPEPIVMGNKLLALLNAPERLAELSPRSVDYARQFEWSRAFDTVTDSLFAAYFAGVDPPASTRTSGFVRAAGGTQVFALEARAKRRIAGRDELDALAPLDNLPELDARTLLSIPSAAAAAPEPEGGQAEDSGDSNSRAVSKLQVAGSKYSEASNPRSANASSRREK